MPFVIRHSSFLLMELTRRNLLIYALLGFTWLLVAGWQVEEHQRVTESARTDLRNRSKDIANTLSALVNSEGVTNPTVISPPFRELTNSMPDAFRGRGFSRREARPDEAGREVGRAVPSAPSSDQSAPALPSAPPSDQALPAVPSAP